MPSFTSPPDPIIFNHQVWDIVRQIPVGKVATYGQIARHDPNAGGRGRKGLPGLRSTLGGRSNGHMSRRMYPGSG